MIFGNRLAKMKLVEQLTLVILQTAHHGSTSPRFASTQRNHGSPPISTDFCNKIGTFRTQLLELMMLVHWAKADIRLRPWGSYFDPRVRPLKPAVGGGQISGAYRRRTGGPASHAKT